MNLLFWLYLIMEEEKDDDEFSILEDLLAAPPTRFDRFMERHKVLDAVWPYIVGIVIGGMGFLIPVLIGMLL